MAGVGVVVVVVGFDLTATHFSFSFPSSVTAEPSGFADSSSEVTLSSVSASTPVVFSDSEFEDDELSSGVGVWTGVAAVVDGVEVATEESPFAAASRRSFLALERASFFSSF